MLQFTVNYFSFTKKEGNTLLELHQFSRECFRIGSLLDYNYLVQTHASFLLKHFHKGHVFKIGTGFLAHATPCCKTIEKDRKLPHKTGNQNLPLH